MKELMLIVRYTKFSYCVKSTYVIEYGKHKAFTIRPCIEYSLPIRSNSKPASGFVSHCMSATMCRDLGSLYIRLYMQPESWLAEITVQLVPNNFQGLFTIRYCLLFNGNKNSASII